VPYCQLKVHVSDDAVQVFEMTLMTALNNGSSELLQLG